VKQLENVIKRFQREMFDRLLTGEHVYYARLEGNRTALCDGCRAYIFDNGDLHIDISECKEFEGISKCLEENGQDQKLRDTYTYIKQGKTLLHKFSAENKAFSIYIDEQLIKAINLCPCSYYAFGSYERVVIKNVITGNVIGLVMPYRYYEGCGDLISDREE